jgi:hypothetical protein
MTAEIANLNKHAVALAADSTATIGVGDGSRRKTYQSANKLFTLSKYHPIGAMIYGNAGLMGVPWETIIKLYRRSLSDRRFAAVADYASDFIRFLETSTRIFPDSLQRQYVEVSAHVCCMQIWRVIKKRVEVAAAGGKAEDSVIAQITREEIDKANAYFASSVRVCDYLPPGFEADLIVSHSDEITSAIQSVFKMPLSEESVGKLHATVGRYICGEYFQDSALSGVVFAGFGEDQIFPEVRTISPHIIANNRLLFRNETNDCYEVTHSEDAALLPFAQRDVVDAFLRGMDSEYLRIITKTMESLSTSFPQLIADHLGESDPAKKADVIDKLQGVIQQLSDGLSQQIIEYRDREHVDPLLAVIGTLPKNELAELAEALVNLTSVKRKMSHDLETVGGPIDVAVISKGDGFIWIRRKHYFKTELNPHFVRNYSREDDHDGSQDATQT